MSERRHGHLYLWRLPAWAPVCFQVWCMISDVRAFFLGGVLLWGGAKFYWAASRSTRGSSMAVEKYFLLTCMRITLFPSLFYDIWSSCVSFLGGLLLWGGVKFCWASSRSTRGSSIGVEKHFPRTCMRISLFSSVFYDFWCSCVSFLGGVLLCGGVKCHWGASRSTCAASSRH